MKKVILVCLLIAVGCCSCSNRETGRDIEQKTVTIYSCDEVDGISYPMWRIEHYNGWDIENGYSWQIEEHPDEMEISFGNTSFQGKFFKTTYFPGAIYTNVLYKEDNGDWFGISSTTGELVYFHRGGLDYSEGTMSEEEVLEIANSIAKEYINVDSFVVTIEETKYINCYQVVYQRYLNDYQIDSYLRLMITSTGETIQFIKHMTDEWENYINEKGVDKVNEFAQILGAEEINRQLLDEVSNSDKWIPEIDCKELVLLPNGDIGMRYFVTIKLDSIYVIDEYRLTFLVTEE